MAPGSLPMAERSRPYRDDPIAEERPELLLFCGLAGLAGCIAPLLAMAISVPVAEHDFVADTISDLGRGPHHWIMDGGFYLNAAGLLALAIAGAHLHLGRTGWSVGVICLAFLALVITLVGIWDEFGTTSRTEDMSVHTQLTFALAPLYLAGPLAMAGGVAQVSPWMRPTFFVSAALWAVFAVAFKLAPDAYDGVLEKIAVAATLLWTVPLSLLFLRRGRARMASD